MREHVEAERALLHLEVGRVIGADAVVMDMTYRPVVTPFLQAARTRGLVTVDGLAMLIGQAAPLFEAAFGQAPPPLDLRMLLIRHLEAVA